ncbi:MAG: hypothetical protein NTY88_08665 [Bacteroidetes bacterium]|nr:hypothetical protein [Bacteroidota bacterium]
MKTNCILVFFLLGSAVLSAQIEHFDIILFGDKIGEMTVSREAKPDGSQFYIIESKSKAKILWISRDNYSHYETVYKNGKFFSSIYKEIENDKVNRWGNTQWDGSKYVVENYHGKKSFTETPAFTIVNLYFDEVKKMNRVFYDTEAEFVSVEHTDENTLEFKTSDGHRNVYHFVNGKIQQVDVHVSFATVKIVRVN